MMNKIEQNIKKNLCVFPICCPLIFNPTYNWISLKRGRTLTNTHKNILSKHNVILNTMHLHNQTLLILHIIYYIIVGINLPIHRIRNKHLTIYS